VTETLKPFVDSNFRTKERQYTGIGGSYGRIDLVFYGLRYPEVFGKLMIFSPSLWVKPDMKINIADESLEDTLLCRWR
jgi:predicted alpha/beta superfamily hydrolase